MSIECPGKKGNYKREDKNRLKNIDERESKRQMERDMGEQRKISLRCLYRTEQGHMMKYCPDWIKIEDMKKMLNSKVWKDR